jgi:hypothetical protein
MTTRIINIISVVILTISASVGLLFDFKDKDGNLTNWGFVALFITIASGVTTILTEILEHRKEKSDEKIEEIKEKERRKLLSEIKEEIVTSSYPLIPFQLFYTLKHTSTEKSMDKFFMGINGYKSMKKNEFLKLVGFAKMSDIPYNSEQEEPKESHFVLQGEKIEEILEREEWEETPIKKHFSFSIEIFTNPESQTPDIVFKSDYLDSKRLKSTTEIRLYDNWLYQDTYVVDWKLHTLKNRIYGLQDLKNARIIVKMQLSLHDKISFEQPPSFTNLQLRFGNNPIILYFTAEDLKNQKAYKSNPFGDLNVKMNGLAEDIFLSQTIEFQTIITEDIFNNQIKQFA